MENNFRLEMCIDDCGATEILFHGNLYRVKDTPDGKKKYIKVDINGQVMEVLSVRFTPPPAIFIAISNREEFNAAKKYLIGRGFIWHDQFREYDKSFIGVYTDACGYAFTTSLPYHLHTHENLVRYKIKVAYIVEEDKDVYKMPTLPSTASKAEALKIIEEIKKVIGE